MGLARLEPPEASCLLTKFKDIDQNTHLSLISAFSCLESYLDARSYFLLPDAIHLLTEKHWLQLIATTAGEGTVESVFAATCVTGTSGVTLKVRNIPAKNNSSMQK